MQAFIKALAWTFVHSLWQGLLAAIVVAIIISATRRTKANLRYNLLGSVLLIFTVIVALTFITQFRENSSSSQAVTITGNAPGYDIAQGSAAIPGGFMNDLTNWFNNNTNILLLIWALFFVVNCLKLMTGLAVVNRLRNYKTHPVTNEWKMKLAQFKKLLSIRQ